MKGTQLWFIFEPCVKPATSEDKKKRKRAATAAIERALKLSVNLDSVDVTEEESKKEGDEPHPETNCDIEVHSGDDPSESATQVECTESCKLNFAVMKMIFRDIVVPTMIENCINTLKPDGGAKLGSLPPMLLTFECEYLQMEANFSVLMPLLTGKDTKFPASSSLQ
jgi:hypothetical protein